MALQTKRLPLQEGSVHGNRDQQRVTVSFPNKGRREQEVSVDGAALSATQKVNDECSPCQKVLVSLTDVFESFCEKITRPK